MKTHYLMGLLGVSWVAVSCRHQDAPATGGGAAALTSQDPTVAGPAVFAAMRAAVEKGDPGDLLRLWLPVFYKRLREDLKKDHDELRGDLERAKRTQADLGLAKSPGDMSLDEFVLASLRASWDAGGKRKMASEVGTKYVSASVVPELRGRKGPFLVIRTETGAADGTDPRRAIVCVWAEGRWGVDPETGDEVSMGLLVRFPVREEPSTVAFDATGARILVGDSRGVSVHTWEGTPATGPAIEGGWVGRIDAASDERVVVQQLGRLRLLRLADLTEVDMPTLAQAELVNVVPGGTLALQNGRAVMRVDVVTGATTHLFSVPEDGFQLCLMCWLAPGRVLMLHGSVLESRSASDGSVSWVVPDVGEGGDRAGMKVGVGGDLLALGWGNVVRVFDHKDGSQSRRLTVDSKVEQVALSRDGRMLAVGTANVTIYNTANWKVVRTLRLHGVVSEPLAWHPRRDLLAVCLRKYGEGRAETHEVGVFDFDN